MRWPDYTEEEWLRAEFHYLAGLIAHALALHWPHNAETATILDDPTLVGRCAECRKPYPCPTTQALDDQGVA